MIGFHVQTPPTDGPRAIAKLPAGAPVKAVDNVQYLSECKRVNPGVFTVLRHWYDHGQHFGGDFEANKEKARAFFSTFIDGTFREHAASVDAVEEWNEYLATSQNEDEIRARLVWAEAAADVWLNEYRVQPEYNHIRLVLCNTAIGNDIDWRFAQIAHDYDCLLSYHAYILTQNGQQPPGDWAYHSGRWATMDAEYRRRGLLVDWIFTEGGPYAGVLEGWRHSSVCGGDVNYYLDALRYWMDNTARTRAYQDGRVYGMTLFTTGGGPVWKYYETKQPEMDRIAELVAGYAPKPPTPPPPPSSERDKYLWRESVQEQIATGLRLNPSAAIQKEIYKAGMMPVHNEIVRGYEGRAYTIQAAEALDGSKARRVYVWTADAGVSWFGEP